MAIKGLEDIDEGVRSAILISVATSYFAWDLGFEFGAHGALFFEKIFFIWCISLALLLIFIIIPRRILPVPRKLWWATAIPTAWVLIGLANRAAPDDIFIRYALTVFGMLAVLICLPYTVYVVVSVIYPEFARMKGRAPKVGIVVVVGIMTLIGYVVGENHAHFLTCEDFAVAGQAVPEDCTPR
jgi:putative Mn2+ efflux pump MntP